ncbi:MAG: histidine kinase [Streptosporangiales bacterium]|jgi:signal transduction histidine kinase|nr:histidine kinase [Streptosporangiales bacterium]
MDAHDVGRMARRTAITCARGLSRAVLAPLEGIPLFVLSLAALVTLPVLAGLWLVPKVLLGVRAVADRQRARAMEWSDVVIEPPGRPRPLKATNGPIGRIRCCAWLLGDPATWRDLLWMLVGAPAGAVLAAPAFAVVIGIGALFGAESPHGAGTELLYLALLPAGIIGGPWLLKGHAVFSGFLLAPTRKELEARLTRVTESRSETVDASAAELRRIERDLHDGAQARIVSFSLSVGLAEQMVRDDPDRALELLAEARASSGQALAELRTLVRGIHPPVLAERGLGGAIEALALTVPIPVDVHLDLPARLPEPVESAVYFAVAEALANVVKHSGADRASVQAEYADGRLVAMVSDNGAGGAGPLSGGGLCGIERRMTAFDGTMAVTSPPGGPTMVTMELPCELSLAKI